MPELRHDFEGTPDATLVAGGPGSNSATPFNNYIDSGSVGAGGTLQYSGEVVLDRTRHVRYRTDTAGGNSFLSWNASRAEIVDDYGSFLLYTDALPTLNVGITQWYSAALASMGKIEFLASGKLGIRNSSGTLVTLTNAATGSTTTLAAATLYRIDYLHHADTVNGLITVRIYSNPAAPVEAYTEEFAPASVFTMPVATSKRFDWGLAAAGASQPTTNTNQFLRMDAVRNGLSNWAGPFSPPRPLRVVRGAARW
jgi:hypothetical protein